VTIDGITYLIRGVLPKDFAFPPAGDAQVWLPIGRTIDVRRARFNHWLRVVGRLREGVSVGAARLRMNDVMRSLAARYPESNSGRGIVITPLEEEIAGHNERTLLVLLGAVGIVLLIAC